VGSGYFDAAPEDFVSYYFYGENSAYGMSSWVFSGAYRSWYATDFVHTTAWRFIGADENDG